MSETLTRAVNSALDVRLSHHAKKRLACNNITLTSSDKRAISNAMRVLEEKGARQSLILYDDISLICSIKNKTIITVLLSDKLSDVTNIDSMYCISYRRKG